MFGVILGGIALEIEKGFSKIHVHPCHSQQQTTGSSG